LPFLRFVIVNFVIVNFVIVNFVIVNAEKTPSLHEDPPYSQH